MRVDLLDRARVAFEGGDIPEARSLVDEALRGTTEWPLRGSVLFSAALVYSADGNPERVVELLTEYLNGPCEGARVAQAHSNRGLALRQLGRYVEAVHDNQVAAEMFGDAGNMPHRCWSLQNGAWVACLAGDAPGAKLMLDQAREILTDEEDQLHQELGKHHLTLLTGDDAQRNDALTACSSLATMPLTSEEVRFEAGWLAGNLAWTLGKLTVASEAVTLIQTLIDSLHPRFKADLEQIAGAVRAG